MEASRCAYKCNTILNSVRQHNHFITQGNYKATCFDYRLVILRHILSIVSQYAMHILGSHRVYIYGIHQIKSFVSKGVKCKFANMAVVVWYPYAGFSLHTDTTPLPLSPSVNKQKLKCFDKTYRMTQKNGNL